MITKTCLKCNALRDIENMYYSIRYDDWYCFECHPAFLVRIPPEAVDDYLRSLGFGNNGVCVKYTYYAITFVMNMLDKEYPEIRYKHN